MADTSLHVGRGRGRTAYARFLELLRGTGRRLGILTNGHQVRLIYAGLDFESWCEWETDRWFDDGEGTEELAGLRQLICPASLEPSKDGTPGLLGAVEESRKRQADLSSVLRENSGSEFGKSLLELSDQLFHWWHRVRDGTLARWSLQKYVGPLRHAVREQLERGAECSCKKTSGTCRKLVRQESAMRTFIRTEAIEPTTGDAERLLRRAVLWRKSSGGTEYAAGGLGFTAYSSRCEGLRCRLRRALRGRKTAQQSHCKSGSPQEAGTSVDEGAAGG